jgi:anaerobic selenocysteine-containing dehydrogenase
MAEEVRKGICRFCHAFCPMDVHIEDGSITKLIGDSNNPVYHGYSCVKGRNFHEWHRSKSRITSPLARNASGNLENIELDDALTSVTEKLQSILGTYGPRSVAMYSGTFSHFCVAGVMTRHSFMDAINSPMRFSNATIDQPGKPIAMALHGRWGAGPQAFSDSDICMLVGANPLVSMWGGIPAFNPARRLHQSRKRGMKLIVIDPRRTESACKADIHLQCKPGFDSEIIAAMIRTIIHEQLFDKSFVAAETEGLEILAQQVEPFKPVMVAKLAGISEEDLIAAARMFATADSGNATGGTGSNMAPNGTLLEYLLLCLNTLCGRWVKAGEPVRNLGVLFRMFSGNAYAEKPRPAFGFGEKLRVRNLGDTAAGLPTAALADEILTPGLGQVKALFVVGGNPLTAFPNREKVQRALESLELLVVIDPQMSATAQLADYVFGPKFGFEMPAISFANEGMVTYGLSIGLQEPYAQYQPALVDTAKDPQLIEDWKVFYEISRRMELQLSYRGTRYDMNKAPTTDELIATFLCRSPVPLDKIKAHPGGHIFEHRSMPAIAKDSNWPYRLQIGDIDMMTELASLSGELDRRRSEENDSGINLLLVSRREHEVYNSVGHSLPAIKRRLPYNPVHMNPSDAQRLKINHGQSVDIRSATGQTLGIVHVTDTVRAGVISVSHGFPNMDIKSSKSKEKFAGTSVSTLIDDALLYDRFSGMPQMSALPVCVTRSDRK